MNIRILEKYFKKENYIINDYDFNNIYIGDVLSIAVAKIKENSIWFTCQNNINVAAVAVLRDVKGIIITEGFIPDKKLIDKCNEEGIYVFTTYLSNYEAIKLLFEKEGLV